MIEEKDLEYVNCNFCGSNKNRPLYKFKDYFKFSVGSHLYFTVVQCEECGLVFLNPCLKTEDLKKSYNSDYFQDAIDPDGRKRNYLEEKPIKIQEFKKAIKRIEKYLDKGKVLDVGCGAGFFLESLDDRWEKYGVEISDFVSKYARKQGLNVYTGELKDANFESEYFDLVYMSQTLDHLCDPKETLLEIKRILKKNGFLVITSPNIESFCSKVFRENYRLLGSNHLYYFSPRSLGNILKMIGFKIRKIEYPYFDTMYFNTTEIKNLIIRIIKYKIIDPILDKKDKVISPPFYGNMMTVIAQKI